MKKKKGLTGLQIVSHVLFLISLLALLFVFMPVTSMWFSVGLFFIIPLLFWNKSLNFKLILVAILIIPFISLNWALVEYVDVGGLLAFMIPVPVFLVVVLSHFVQVFISNKKKFSIVLIILFVMIISASIIFSAIHVSKTYTDNHNSNVRQNLKCLGAYTSTPAEEFSQTCDAITIGGYKESEWIEMKQYCDDLVNKISQDKYYFDFYDFPENKFGFRNPRNWEECRKRDRVVGDFALFQESRSIYRDDVTLSPPESEDPQLCDVYKITDRDVVIKILRLDEDVSNATITNRIDDCYLNIAVATADVSYCEKAEYAHACYYDAAKKLKDTTICDRIEINEPWNVNEDYVRNCKFQVSRDLALCDEMSSRQQLVGCYSNYVIVTKEYEVCDIFTNETEYKLCRF